ncbi:MAG TPA: helix-turn-helix transcriptional regulator [Gaiellaceae bacterium]|nr:helix-turn-helix transcriptional regulator [Gaiellaceae bacterium]
MASEDLNGLSYVVLALIGRGGASPHELVRMGERGQRLHWAGAASKVYAEPKRLERLGYLQSERQPGKTRERTYYMLTDKGLDALREWLLVPSVFPRIQNEAAMRVFASDLLPDPEAVVASLRPLRDEIAAQVAILDESEQRARTTLARRQRQLLLVHGLGRRLLAALSDWIDDVEREFGAAEREPDT